MYASLRVPGCAYSVGLVKPSGVFTRIETLAVDARDGHTKMGALALLLFEMVAVLSSRSWGLDECETKRIDDGPRKLKIEISLLQED